MINNNFHLMTKVTLKAIEDLLDKKFDVKLKPINDRIETVSTKLETVSTKLETVSTKLETVSTKLEAVAETASNHTVQLDGIAKDVKTLIEANTVNNYRLDRLEKWGVKTGEKTGVKLQF